MYTPSNTVILAFSVFIVATIASCDGIGTDKYPSRTIESIQALMNSHPKDESEMNTYLHYRYKLSLDRIHKNNKSSGVKSPFIISGVIGRSTAVDSLGLPFVSIQWVDMAYQVNGFYIKTSAGRIINYCGTLTIEDAPTRSYYAETAWRGIDVPIQIEYSDSLKWKQSGMEVYSTEVLLKDEIQSGVYIGLILDDGTKTDPIEIFITSNYLRTEHKME